MSAEIINLRQARKEWNRQQKQSKTTNNRSTFGLSPRERKLRAARDEIEQKRHEGHRLSSDEPAS